MRRSPRMAQLVHGSDVVDLSLVSQFGDTIFSAQQGGLGSTTFTPQQLETGASLDQQLFSDQWALVIHDSRVGAVASMTQRLIRMLRSAWQFHYPGIETTPTYLIVQVPGEAGVRSAVVHSSPSIRGANPLFSVPMEDDQSILDFGVTINRFVWRAVLPNTLPPLVCMTSSKVVGVTLGSEKILNPGFETAGGGGADVFADWGEIAGDGTITRTNVGAEVHSGTWACKITNGPTSNTIVYRQGWTIIPGHTYNFSIWMRGDGTHYGTVGLFDGGLVLTSLNSAVGATYVQYTYRFTATLGMTTLQANLSVQVGNTFWAAFDDVSLKEITDQPCSTMVQVGNFRDRVGVTHIFLYDDSATTYSANLVGQASISLFPAATAVNDALLIGSVDGPLHDVVIPIGIPGVMVATALVQIWTGAAFVTLAAGTEYTIYPSSLGTDLFTLAGDCVINIFGKTGWAANALNSVTAWWIKVTLNPFTSMGTIPVTSATQTIASAHDPSIEIPAASLKGDILAMMLLRLGHPAGGLAVALPGITSRIIIGSKSRGLTNFVSHLNLGNAGNPATWATVYGTDASAIANRTAPQGVYGDVSFATDATEIVRITLTGTNMMPDYTGRYRVLVAAKQVGGAAGDCSVKLRARMIDTGTYRTKFDTPAVVTKGTPTVANWEMLDLGTLRLPLIEETNYDPLTCTLLFQLLASRAGGTSTLWLGMLVLIPIDEWSATLDDPVSDPVTGPSALRGGTFLYVDGGIIRTRSAKHQRIGSVDTLMEPWYRDGAVPALEPRRATKLFFLMLHYPTMFGTGPMQVSLGQQLTAELYTVARYLYLRGDE